VFRKLVNYILGTCEVTVSVNDRSEVFDYLYRDTIPFYEEKLIGDLSVFSIHKRNVKLLQHFAEESGIEISFSEVRGLPVALSFMKKRPILPIGFVLCTVWIFLSHNIVWDIQIEGNTKTPDSEILEKLDELGFSIGTYYPSINFNQLHADYSAMQHDIAWLSIYMNGVVAEVQVRELWKDEREKHEEGTYANVIASCDGIVREVNVFEGQAAVRAGDFVREGQVLISGVVEKKDGGIRYEYAAGEVICEVAVPIRVEIPCEREEKVYTGRETIKKSVKIFKKTINFFVNGGIEYTTCDKIDMMEQVCPFGIGTLPIWLNTSVYREFEMQTVSVSPDMAADEAMANLSERIKEESFASELVSKSVDTAFEDGVFSVDCVLSMNRDIGKTAEFTADDTDTAMQN